MKIILLCLLFIVDSCKGNLPFDLNLSQADITQNGIAFPTTIDVVKGHDVMVKLLKTARNQEHCILRTPNFTMIDVANKNDRIELWGDACGVKIKNVQHADEGMWRLISEEKSEKIEGFFSLFIHEINPNINESVDIKFNETEEKSFIHFGNKNTYCFLTREKETQNSFIHGNCSLPVDKVTQNLEGLWTVKMGVKGNMDEEQSQTMVNVNVEEVDVGYTDDLDKNVVNMYCNLKNYAHSLDFCRFERVSDARGFHLAEGIGKDRYSYFGQGLVKNQCGITIKEPIQEDYGVWRCSIGFRINQETTKNFDRLLTLHKPGDFYLLINKILNKHKML